MGQRPLVLLTTEGTYPFHQGGVSTWCDALVHQLPAIDFIIFAIAMNPYVSVLFDLPENVQRVISVPLWGMQDPSEHRDEVAFSEIFLQKQRTGTHQVHDLFIPSFQQFLEGLLEGSEPGQIGRALAQMYRYFRTYDYQTTFKSEEVWAIYKAWVLLAVRRGYWREPSVFESVQGLGWIYHFLTILNTAIPAADLIHSSAAAFCGMVGIVSKIEYNTPYVLTEHGVYVREQYLSIGRSNMTPFSKRFLIALVKAISKENLYYADELAPVCAFNGRWERVLGASPEAIHVIYNGVDASVFHPDNDTLRIPSSDDAIIPINILSVARIDPNKDLETLLHAVHLVKSFGIPIKVKIQGSVSVPQYFDQIKQLQRQLGLQTIVDFSGHTPDISQIYRETDITVQSSVTEAFPYSVIESMMSGVPMIATDVGGTREALGDTGILVPSRDPHQLALGIAMLAKDQELRARLSKRARERALRYFEISHTMSAFFQLYHRWQKRRQLLEPQPPKRDAVMAVTRAFILLKLKHYSLALQQYQAALNIVGNNPASMPLLMEMAHIEIRMGRYHDAFHHLIKFRMIQSIFETPPSKIR